eukprot:GHVP01024123.1.p1 GENE.GHVP01024123.1~~GHVP01024123.1.p1  ORF type:complete len:140 (+),score=22.67 GHVP01024123.1:164-583(+)
MLNKRKENMKHMFEVIYNENTKSLSLKKILELEPQKDLIQIAQTSTNKHPIYVSSKTLSAYKKVREVAWFKINAYLILIGLIILFLLTLVCIRVVKNKKKRKKENNLDFIVEGVHEVFWKNSFVVPKDATNISLHCENE